jgi:DNA-binding GntR family transcriptional regulator
MAASNREHRAILSAIARRDPEEAMRLVIVHSQLLRERLVSLFDDGDEVLDAPEAMSSVSVGNC